MWAKQPYHKDFSKGSKRPRKSVSFAGLDAQSVWPTRSEDFRFDAQDPSDVTWHRYVPACLPACLLVCCQHAGWRAADCAALRCACRCPVCPLC